MTELARAGMLKWRLGAGRAAFLVAAVVGQLVAHAPAGAQQGFAAGTGNIMGVCIAALLTPEALPQELSARGMEDMGPMHLPPGWDGTIYGAKAGKLGVTIGYQRYSDFRITTCTLVIAMTAAYDDLVGLRTLLEADPRVGKLEGRILTATPTVRMATFKRPGNAPIVTFTFTTSATATSLVMSRMDLQPES
jgi:hypothetical protein